MNNPQQTRERVEQEAQAIWCITELLSKLGSVNEVGGDCSVQISTATLGYFSKQIDTHVNNMVEAVDAGGSTGG